MEGTGGYATLGYLNQNVLKIKDCEWKTKTPFASIRRIVQDSRYFFKIKPGLWALKSFQDKLPAYIYQDRKINDKRQDEFNHSYYQGLLVEIGNLKKYHTFVPNQDKNKLFLGKKLCEIVSINKIYDFSYDNIVKQAQSVDVIWFNNRKMPKKMFEVEHSTNIEHSLVKFNELQDFYSDYYIVADIVRKRQFDEIVNQYTFREIKERVRFFDYQKISDLHTKEFELYASKLNI
jgi:hypothetical protein